MSVIYVQGFVQLVEFIKVLKRRPYSERLKMIAEMLNQKGELSVVDLVAKMRLSPDYCKRLLSWFPISYPYAEWREEEGLLVIRERKIEGR